MVVAEVLEAVADLVVVEVVQGEPLLLLPDRSKTLLTFDIA